VVTPPPRIAAVIRHVVWVGIVAHAGFVPMFGLIGHLRLAAFNVLSVATWIAAAIVNRRGRSTVAMWLLTLEVVAHAVLAAGTLGWASGFQYYLVPLIPFVMFNDRLGGRTVAAISAGVFTTLIALRALAPEGELDGSMALTDPLTGLLNRRSMEQRLREAVQAFQRTGRPFSVIMADVDHFKRINDVHGHEAGDGVLRAVAALLGARLRGHDALARWGGEEFLLLLPETDLAAACDVADRLRAAAEAELGHGAGFGQSVTLTFGVSVFDRPMRVAACLKQADDALYAGKAGGRNRVVRAASG